MNSMYCAEQINIPPELGSILKQYTKAVIKERPEDVYKFSANFFASLAGMVPPFDQRGQLVSGEGERQTSSSAAGAAKGPMANEIIPDAGNFEAVQGGASDEISNVIASMFRHYDTDGSGRIDIKELPAFISDLRDSLGWEAEDRTDFTAEAIISMLDDDNNGTLGMEEFRQFFFSDN